MAEFTLIHFLCRIHLWFRLFVGSAEKFDDVTALPCRTKMADMRYYGNVMTRWRLYVTMETLWQQQDGGYALLLKRFLHLQQYSHRLNFNLSFGIKLLIEKERDFNLENHLEFLG